VQCPKASKLFARHYPARTGNHGTDMRFTFLLRPQIFKQNSKQSLLESLIPGDVPAVSLYVTLVWEWSDR